jgi:SpoVK/Ycf46/Vps4 family AAA+-type ATPase
MPDTAESRYAKGKTAEWLLNVKESGIPFDSSFLDCAEWVLGDFRNVALRIKEQLKTIVMRSELLNAREEIEDILLKNERRILISDDIDDFIRSYPRSDKIVEEAIWDGCAAAAKTSKTDGAVYLQARRRLRRIFGLDDNACTVCEFIFIKDTFRHVGNYFETHLETGRFAYIKRFADMFRMKNATLQKCLSELVSWGICEFYNASYELADGIGSFWENASPVKAEGLFCRPLSGYEKMKTKHLPLEDFGLPADDVAHVRALLESEGERPIHILLYGEPGTGKTTFARTLAKTLKLKAWSVPCSDQCDSGNNSRAGLSACLNMASKHKNAFVLLDEAERFLDTGDHFGRQTKDKAWLNDFLEQPGRRIVWIVNDIDHVHPSVRRRFTFSLCFKPLNCEERRRIWKSILKEQKAALPEEQVRQFARDYPISPAIVESAVHQAKILTLQKHDSTAFAATAERVLRSYVTLSRDGERPALKPRFAGEYSLEGVCLEGSVEEILEKCRRIDAMMKEEKPIRPGGATMLFYGPPGSGKSAFAKYLADELERELVVKRASDLLSPWVGVSEQNVANAFNGSEKAVLVIDEADSFLYSRDSSARSWENTLVNEFLTSLEQCRGFCICTTNRMKDMDEAAMRRFSFKIPFGYASTEQAEALYKSLLAPVVNGALPKNLEEKLARLQFLTPGDFHTVKSQYWLAGQGEVTHEQLLESLAREEKLKRDGQARRIGFFEDI